MSTKCCSAIDCAPCTGYQAVPGCFGIALHNILVLLLQRRMVEELLKEDGLTILAAGLTWQRVAGVLVRLQLERRR